MVIQLSERRASAGCRFRARIRRRWFVAALPAYAVGALSLAALVALFVYAAWRDGAL